MNATKTQTMEAATTNPVAVTNACQRKRPEKDQSLMANLKDQFKEFYNTPMEEHKVCFKLSVQKMKGKFREMTWASKQDENSAGIEAGAPKK